LKTKMLAQFDVGVEPIWWLLWT